MSPEDVVARHEGLVLVIARQHATDLVPAEDLAQEARVALFREAEKRPGDDLAKVASWIVKRRVLRVASSGVTLADRRQGEGRHVQSAPVSVWTDGLPDNEGRQAVEYRAGLAPSAEDVALRRIEAERVRAAVYSLDGRAREVAIARLAEEPTSETARRLETSPDTVRRLWDREAAPALREALVAA